ncbi:putative MFS family arabinose efflux permease|uniref:Putative MFS family arabinose efflux permease n=1 Tax=Brenneria salicis ATCC 15712 = DSM 30166 TaxID=714314 RepID=A0A366I700_9GAMM|nr:MFS transporter [Brenneria salicis]NMN90167.1 putative MFS family arabinose efflux permease [Brenneria salicis ATCC 15712 = DSM 30166]RBP63212.1 putative MFS family arabinose efflux permease [Brenneria salicis ATCC 15712 = DSM 30166]RLM30892.1 multidrug resistance protein [Brenneria salicis ATCC 15712 = DSM 30166]
MDALSRNNLILLVLGQGLTGSIISLITLSSTLVGILMTPVPLLTTLPITSTVCGATLMIYSVSSLMAKYGRRNAFIFGALLGVTGSLLAAWAIVLNSFALFVFSTFMLGMSCAFNQYYRFAAAEIFTDQQQKSSAISWVISGGILGGFIGPFAASQSAYLWSPYPFFGSFIAGAVICTFTALLLLGLKLPNTAPVAATHKEEASLFSILKSRAFMLGTVSCTVGFVVMTLLMNSAPLAMHQHHFSVDNSATALQWHFVAMYAPALLLVVLAKRMSATQVIVTGILCNVIGIVVALSGVTFWHFLVALIMYGIGWAFMFNGGTFMLNTFTHSVHKSRLQGINSLAIAIPNALASLSAGSMMALTSGWPLVNMFGIAVLLLMVLLLARAWRG